MKDLQKIYNLKYQWEDITWEDITYEEKLIFLFDFYMLVVISKISPKNYCPFENELIDFNCRECGDCDICDITEIEDVEECDKCFKTQKTLCSEFKFISSKNKNTCPCGQFTMKGSFLKLRKLLEVENFIPKISLKEAKKEIKSFIDSKPNICIEGNLGKLI